MKEDEGGGKKHTHREVENSCTHKRKGVVKYYCQIKRLLTERKNE